MPPGSSQRRPNLLDSSHNGVPDYARLLVSSRTVELPYPSDENEQIITNSLGQHFAVANTSTKASCQARFPGLSCEFFFAPGSDDVLLDIVSYTSPPDLISAPMDGRISQHFEALTTPTLKLPLFPTCWTIRWSDPRDAREKLSADIVILPRPFLLRNQPASPERPPTSWDNSLLTIKKGHSFTIQSPARFSSSVKENYSVVCRQVLYRGNSVVFLGHHDNHGTVAVKFLKLAVGNQCEAEFMVPNRIQEWTREVQTLRRLSHPNIVKYISSDARLCSVVTEHKPWGTLGSCLSRSRRNYFGGGHQDGKDILKDMSAALHYLDSKRISHNDIRPANMLYRRGQPCILVDFGSACSHDEVNIWSMCHYLCPEYLVSRQRGAKSDIFSLGVVMLWVLREIPLPEATESTWDAIQAARSPDSLDASLAWKWQVHLQVCRERLEPRSGTKHLVFRMLDPNPDTRISIRDLIQQA